jgi:hypothetical protein
MPELLALPEGVGSSLYNNPTPAALFCFLLFQSRPRGYLHQMVVSVGMLVVG